MSGRHAGGVKPSDRFIADQFTAWLTQIDAFVATVLPAERTHSYTMEQQFAEILRRLDVTTELLCTGRQLAMAVLDDAEVREGAEFDRVFDLAGDNDPTEWRP